MLTIFFGSTILDHVSYIWTKYSDFSLFRFYKFFQILPGIGYNIYMAILDNVDNDSYPLFENESSSLAIKIFSDMCCNGCSCRTESDHQLD